MAWGAAWIDERGGPDRLYQIDITGKDSQKIRDGLTKHGVKSRTLALVGGNTRVLVINQGDDPEVRRGVAAFAKETGCIRK